MGKVVFGLLTSLFFFMISGCRTDNCIIEEIIDLEGIVMKRAMDKCNGNFVLQMQEFIRVGDSLIPHGPYEIHFANRLLKKRGFFKSGKLDSIHEEYHDNGKLSIKELRAEDHFVGPQYYYDASGGIDSISYYTAYGVPWLILTQPKDNAYLWTGNLIRFTFGDNDERLDSIPLNGSLGLLMEVPFLQNCNTVLHVRLKKDGKNIKNEEHVDFDEFYNMHFTGFKHTFTQKGNYEFTTLTIIKDSLQSQLIADSFQTTICVY